MHGLGDGPIGWFRMVIFLSYPLSTCCSVLWYLALSLVWMQPVYCVTVFLPHPICVLFHLYRFTNFIGFFWLPCFQMLKLLQVWWLLLSCCISIFFYLIWLPFFSLVFFFYIIAVLAYIGLFGTGLFAIFLSQFFVQDTSFPCKSKNDWEMILSQPTLRQEGDAGLTKAPSMGGKCVESPPMFIREKRRKNRKKVWSTNFKCERFGSCIYARGRY